jgi:hypothetical protein
MAFVSSGRLPPLPVMIWERGIMFADYLGHRSIAWTVRYTALAPDRFKGFWKD